MSSDAIVKRSMHKTAKVVKVTENKNSGKQSERNGRPMVSKWTEKVGNERKQFEAPVIEPAATVTLEIPVYGSNAPWSDSGKNQLFAILADTIEIDIPGVGQVTAKVSGTIYG